MSAVGGRAPKTAEAWECASSSLALCILPYSLGWLFGRFSLLENPWFRSAFYIFIPVHIVLIYVQVDDRNASITYSPKDAWNAGGLPDEFKVGVAHLLVSMA